MGELLFVVRELLFQDSDIVLHLQGSMEDISEDLCILENFFVKP